MNWIAKCVLNKLVVNKRTCIIENRSIDIVVRIHDCTHKLSYQVNIVSHASMARQSRCGIATSTTRTNKSTTTTTTTFTFT